MFTWKIIHIPRAKNASYPPSSLATCYICIHVSILIQNIICLSPPQDLFPQKSQSYVIFYLFLRLQLSTWPGNIFFLLFLPHYVLPIKTDIPLEKSWFEVVNRAIKCLSKKSSMQQEPSEYGCGSGLSAPPRRNLNTHPRPTESKSSF